VATLGLSEAEREAIERFERSVIQPSMAALVILEFATQPSPVLAAVTAEYAAKGVKLVTLDVAREKLIAAQFRVQAVPTVYAFFEGQPVADITPYRSEAQLKSALDQLLAQLKIGAGGAAAPQPDIEPLMAMGEQILGEGDAARAVSIFRQIRDMAPDDPEVAGALVRALVAAGELDEARATLDSLPADSAAKPAIARARAALELASSVPADTAGIEARIAANADDHDARFELAGARAAAGDRDAAADALLEIIARDKDWNEGAARKRFLQLLEAQGLEDPWTRDQRRRLSALLFT
jgi:putative thioredoxin